MKTPCPGCFGWEEDHEGWTPPAPNQSLRRQSGVCPGRPDGVEGLVSRELERRAPVVHRLGKFAFEMLPWLRGR